jgi:hypothetical protein
MTTNPAPKSPVLKPRPAPPVEQQEAIRRRADEIYVRSGRLPGRDIENWVQAEKEVLQERGEHPAPRAAVVVNVNGVQYTGEYSLDAADGYTPGEFSPGALVPVRFAGSKMFVTRPNGGELETFIVNKTG